MKKQLARAFVAATMTLGFATTAQAIPIQFNFTGTNTGSATMPPGSIQGQTVAGGFTFETDGLVRREAPLIAMFESYSTANPLAFISFGDRHVTFPSYGTFNHGYILFGDGCSGDVCSGDDNFALFASTAELSPEIIASGFTGNYRAASLMFSTQTDGNLRGDQFDYLTVDPMAILNVEMGTAIGGRYIENEYTCFHGECSALSSTVFGFNADSVTRTAGTRDVPEPGTAGLFGLAGLMTFLFRRRRARR